MDEKERCFENDGGLHLTVCAQCGKEAKVPFQPNNDRPVYCSECFAEMKNQ